MFILRAFVALTSAAALFMITACSSGSPAAKPSSTDSWQAQTSRDQRLYPLFVQCLAQHNIPIWDKSQGDMQVAEEGLSQGWYKDGRVIDNDAYQEWQGEVGDTYPQGPLWDSVKDQPQTATGNALVDGTFVGTVDWWVAQGAVNGKWPPVCGALPKA